MIFFRHIFWFAFWAVDLWAQSLLTWAKSQPFHPLPCPSLSFYHPSSSSVHVVVVVVVAAAVDYCCWTIGECDFGRPEDRPPKLCRRRSSCCHYWDSWHRSRPCRPFSLWSPSLSSRPLCCCCSGPVWAESTKWTTCPGRRLPVCHRIGHPFINIEYIYIYFEFRIKYT